MNKKIIAPILTVAAMMAAAVGTTYALFTSDSKTDVSITSGKVSVSSALSELSAYTPTSISTAPGNPVIDATNKADNSAAIKVFGNGGTAKIEGNLLTLSNIAPGDKVTFKITVTNDSNIKIKYRYTTKVVDDNGLFVGLTVKKDDEVFSSFDKTNWEEWNEAGSKTSTITVELPTDAGNEFQDKACSVSFMVEAVQGNAYVTDEDSTAYMRAANKALKLSAGDNETPTDAINESITALSKTFDEIFPVRENNSYAWDKKHDQFVIVPNSLSAQENVNYYVFVDKDSYATWASYSRYLLSSNPVVETTLDISTGLDVGEVSGITKVNYVNTASTKEVIIRTNSVDTDLYIKSPLDTVTHYGVAGEIEIESVADSSFHEKGIVAFVGISKGRIVLEQTADVKVINVNKKASEDAYDDITIANNGVLAKNLPEVISRDQVTVSSEKTEGIRVVEIYNVSTGTSEIVKAYPAGSTVCNSTVKVTEGENKQNENVNSALGQLVLDSEQSKAGEKAYDAAKKEEVKEEKVKEVEQQVCQHDGGFDYSVNVSDKDKHDKECKKCHKVWVEGHTYDAEHVENCIYCGYGPTVYHVVSGTPGEGKLSLAEAINTYNNNSYENNVVIELEKGTYIAPVGSYVINQNKINAGYSLTFRAKDMASAKTNWDVIIKADSSTIVTGNTNQSIFAVSGGSGFENGGEIKFEGLKFDMSDPEFAKDKYQSGTYQTRIFAVSCASGNEGRYAHNITLDYCNFVGCGGKMVSAIGANHNNSCPSAITISNSVGDKLNCWFNGYVADNKGFGLKLENLSATNFLCIANNMSNGSTVDLDNVDGSYFYDKPNDESLTDGLSQENGVVYTIGGVVKMKDCDISLLSAPKATPAGFVYSKVTGSNLSVSATSCTFTNTTGTAVNDLYVKSLGAGCTLTVNGSVKPSAGAYSLL